MIRSNVFIVVTIAVIAINSSVHADYYGDLRQFYITKLFAIETRISILKNHNNRNKRQDQELINLREDKSIIERRLDACSYYYERSGSWGVERFHTAKEEIDRIIQKKARKYGINPNFIKALVKCESDYNTYARSRKGAMGLTQLMPKTCKDMGVKNPWSPAENIEGGIRYITLLLKEFKDARKALQAYNCGPEVLRRGKTIPLESERFANAVLAHFKRLNSER